MQTPAGRGASGPRSEINVTPLVDVVLVLLIIFMVVIPVTQLGQRVAVPLRSSHSEPGPAQVVVRMDARGTLFLNREEVLAAALPARLRAALAQSGARMVLVAAAGELPYDRVAELLDRCRGAGVERLGIVLDDL